MAGIVPKAAEPWGQHGMEGKLAGTTEAATHGVGEERAHWSHSEEICYCNSDSFQQ